MATRHVAILGGGITGLTSAFYVSRRFPDALVTVLEKSPTLGGWLKSERVDITSRSSVLLEAGPRSFRPGAKGLMELINLLGLTPHLLTTPKSSPAARNRYLHLPPNRGLVAVPSSIWGALTSPLRSLLIPPILREALRAPNRPGSDCAEEHDESVDAFLTRRFGAEFARVFGSSLVHGIYAADARRVSMRAAFGRIWEMGERAGGSVVRGMVGQTVFGGRKPPKAHTYELGEVEERLRGVSIFSFRDGVGMIVDRLEQWLRARRGVRICVETSVSSLGYNPELDKFNVLTSRGESLSTTHVISALPLPALSLILPRTQQLPHLTANASSSVTVINLVYPFNPRDRPIHPVGYGYLVPRPNSGYTSEECDGILGCVFDGCAITGQDAGLPATKLTVMHGGPYPCAASMPKILKRLEHQLGLATPLPEPVLYRVHEHQGCIPVPEVGHLGRMEEMRRALNGLGWGQGRFDIIGAGVSGVSVPDCVDAARSAASM